MQIIHTVSCARLKLSIDKAGVLRRYIPTRSTVPRAEIRLATVVFTLLAVLPEMSERTGLQSGGALLDVRVSILGILIDTH